MKVVKFIMMVVFLVVMSVAMAEKKGPYLMTVADIRELQPGSEWDPSSDDVFVEVRGYLRDSINMYIYATRDQALLDDFSGVLVSDEGEGRLRANCSEGYVELVARLGWMETERRPILVPTEAKKLTLREHIQAEEEYCWRNDTTNLH